MTYKIVLSIVILLFHKLSFGQELENRIFELLCKDIVNDYRLDSSKLNLKGVELVVDTLTFNKEFLVFSNQKKEKELLKQHGKDKLFKILKARDYPIFPLSDTLYIIDTVAFFSKEIFYKFNGHCFKVVKYLKDNMSYPAKSVMSVFATGISGNELRLAFSFNDYDWLFTYSFKLKYAKVELTNKNSVPLKFRYYRE